MDFKLTHELKLYAPLIIYILPNYSNFPFNIICIHCLGYKLFFKIECAMDDSKGDNFLLYINAIEIFKDSIFCKLHNKIICESYFGLSTEIQQTCYNWWCDL